MFSTTTMASSTTKPTAMVSAISDRLSRLKPNRYISAVQPKQRQRHGHARNERGADVAQEQQDHHHHQADGDGERELDVLDRSANGLGAVDDGVDLQPLRRDRGEPRHGRLNGVDGADDIGARLLVDDQQNAGRDAARQACQRPLGDVLRPGDRVADVADADRRAGAIADDDVVILFRLGQLVVGRDGEGLQRAVDRALWRHRPSPWRARRARLRASARAPAIWPDRPGRGSTASAGRRY